MCSTQARGKSFFLVLILDSAIAGSTCGQVRKVGATVTETPTWCKEMEEQKDAPKSIHPMRKAERWGQNGGWEANCKSWSL